MKRLGENIEVVIGVALQSVEAETAIEGGGIAVGEAQGVAVLCMTGTMVADSSVVFQVQVSDDNATWADLEGATCTLAEADDEDDGVQIIDCGHIIQKYVQVVATPDGVSAENAATLGALVVHYGPRSAPVDNTPAAVIV